MVQTLLDSFPIKAGYVGWIIVTIKRSEVYKVKEVGLNIPTHLTYSVNQGRKSG
jgi:hypothetical protein